MANTIMNSVASYLTGLGATHTIPTAFGTTFTFGGHLFIVIGPATDSDSLTLVPYGGGTPNIDGYRQNPAIQIRTRTKSRNRAMSCQQALINNLHTNELSGEAIMFAVQSIPIFLGTDEGGEHTIVISNYTIKHVKV